MANLMAEDRKACPHCTNRYFEEVSVVTIHKAIKERQPTQMEQQVSVLSRVIKYCCTRCKAELQV